jgi:hypothetical protein
VLLALACTSPVIDSADDPIPQMSPVDLLIRSSLDLRGVRPTVVELDQIEAEPEALDALIEGFVDDPRFEGRVRDLWAEILLTRADVFPLADSNFGLDNEAGFTQAVGEEALRLIGRVASEDRPWTEIVTADWTMANEMLEAIWPLERQEGEGWVEANYTDGRPHSGVLTTNSLMWRYTTTPSNANRRRANAISRIFLCNDYLDRPINFDRNVNLLDEEALADAINNNPSCVNCHNTLDPLASFLFGFFTYNPYAVNEITAYHPDREKLWQSTTGTAPAFFGVPGYNMDDLGHAIAGDNRFVECAVEQTWELMLRRETLLEDNNALTLHREAFLASGLSYKALILSVLSDPRYRAGATDEAGYVPRKMATPDLLATQVEALTGFEWTYMGFDMLRSDTVGLRMLAGGSDGNTVTQTALEPNTTIVLVQERLAHAAAWYAAEQDALGEARIFTAIDFTETPEDKRDAMVQQLQDLHWRIFGNRVLVDGEEVNANLDLWEEFYEVSHDPVDAWAGVLAVLLRDPDFLLY